MKLFTIQLFILFTFLNTPAIPLSGPQHGEYERRDYHVTGTVTVPAGKTMTIPAGSILRFDRYTGLIVRGTLRCPAADTVRGVLFTTSVNEGDYPLWNGIEVDSGGSVFLENCYVYNSVCGLRLSDECREAAIENTLFRDNENDFSAGSSPVIIEKDAPFTYFRNVKPKSITPADGAAEKRGWKIPVRLSLGAAAVAGCVLSVVFHNDCEDYKQKYDNAGEDAASIREKGNSALYRRNAAGVIGAAALAGFVVTFFF